MHPLRALRERGEHTADDVAALLSPDIVFSTPVLVKAVTGRRLVSRILALSSQVRSGHYEREHRLDERTTFLFWSGSVAGRHLQSMEILEDDDDGLIVSRTVAYRPFPALELFRAEMYRNLKSVIGAEYWTYTPDDPTSLPGGAASGLSSVNESID